ncbi:MAG: hypothetical protein EXR62_13680 [Chloroflexi bacterium]|nr:hypothetical protein [Chloroflexota bacterium]
MEEQEKPENSFGLIAGWLCLDFTNTVSREDHTLNHERLHSYADLVAWSQQAQILNPAAAQELLWEAWQRPEATTRVVAQAIQLREVIYEIFSDIAAGRKALPASLAQLNGALAQALVHSRVVPQEEGFAWEWEEDTTALVRVLWPVAKSAADLLIDGELDRVGECANDACGWLFIDTSRNHSRRWCDMKDCGNRAKAQRHYTRKKKKDGMEARA